MTHQCSMMVDHVKSRLCQVRAERPGYSEMQEPQKKLNKNHCQHPASKCTSDIQRTNSTNVFINSLEPFNNVNDVLRG